MTDSSFTPVYNSSQRELALFYSCPQHHVCSSMQFSLPKGRYFIECYGAGGGSWRSEGSSSFVESKSKTRTCPEQGKVDLYRGNTKCNPYDNAGSGAYMSGFLTLKHTTNFYAAIGGSGVYSTSKPSGGFNGGASGGSYSNGCSSGGGATDLRAENDDYFHRIIVAGGGGGVEDSTYTSSTLFNDGAGGSAGYPEGQGYWIDGEYNGNNVSDQLKGFSFGQGEATKITGDSCGSGGGWFGGFASQHNNGGCGGGSSFILKKDATVPTTQVTVKTETGEELQTDSYKFSSKRKYLFDNIQYSNGIWSGDGMMRITFINEYKFCTRSIHRSKTFVIVILLFSS